MPKLKNSAVWAISSAVSAPRGTSIIVPTRVLELLAGLLHHFAGHAVDDLDLQIELALEADQRDHHFGLDFDAFLQHGGGGLEDGAGLHLGDFGILDAQAAAAEAEHGVELVQLVDALVDGFDRDAELLGDFLLALGIVVLRQEFVQRRIEQADARRPAVQCPEDAFEIALLQRQQFGERLLAIVQIVGQNHLRARR